ncbi:MAG: hypothetical protein U0175_07505 [Caldilineaceae bacterium]
MPPRTLRLWRIATLLLYLVLTCSQLGLPGLHYDEAKEAGVNALELLSGAPITAFRGATVPFFGISLPLMVQDYIGALNVYLALPFLKLTGVGVPNLRILSVLTGLGTLLLLEQVVTEWIDWWTTRKEDEAWRRLSHVAALAVVTLLAISPTFIFWSRQGIFVTNLTQPLCLWAIWQGLCWLRRGHPVSLVQAAFASGLAIYAKLLAVWVIVPFWALVLSYLIFSKWGAGGVGRWEARQIIGPPKNPQSAIRIPQSLFLALPAFLLGLSPLLLFNWQTGGTLFSVGGNLTQSYYGVNNLDLASNFLVRARQIVQILQGNQFDYLGGVFSDWLAPWLVAGILVMATLRNWRFLFAPLVLLLCAFMASLFTVSGLFVTHYALLQPLLYGLVGIALYELRIGDYRILVAILLMFWFCIDLSNTLRYHQVLSQSGGLGDHSDASYHLAYDLRYNGMGAPIALDWGMDATVRYLSEGTVRPIEIFGYESLQQPDPAFQDRLAPFLQNPDNVYLLRAPQRTVFVGRREAFLQAVEHLGQSAKLEKTFAQRNREVLFELWRVTEK